MNRIEQLRAELEKSGLEYRVDEPLCQHTTFCIGGPAALFFVPANTQQLAGAVLLAKQYKVPYFLLGNGSNVLFKDEGYPGIIISLAKLGSIEVDGNSIVAGAGAALQNVCTTAQQQGLSGLEFAYGIPGSVGGAVFMNAGAYNGEMCDVLEKVEYLDENGNVVQAQAQLLELGYRTSIFHKKNWCVLRARFALKHDSKDAILETMRQHMQSRTEKQPLDMPSAGSAFKRPQGAFAAALIDQCGLRGYSVGKAAISQKHCGFIVNLGGATCADVLELARQVSEIVQSKTGYLLEREVRVIDAQVQQ